MKRRAATILLSLCFCSQSCLCFQGGVDILGTHYSERLRLLILRVEKESKTTVHFETKTNSGDDNIRREKDLYSVTLAPGVSEDDIAHELTHALLESEGYAKVFCLPSIPFSATIYPFLNSDFDHVIINQRLHREGYHPEVGFMANMKNQYKSVLSLSLPTGLPEQRAILGMYIIHSLMKHVYYVEAPEAEGAILAAFPQYRTHWTAIKTAILEFRNNPDPLHEWKLIEMYVKTMDQIFSESGYPTKFSDLIGFSPLLVTRNELRKPASQSISMVSDASYTRMKVKGVMVNALAGHPSIDLASSLGELSRKSELDVWLLATSLH